VHLLADLSVTHREGRFTSESCEACHGDDRVGTNTRPKLAGATAKKSGREVNEVVASSHREDNRSGNETG
jgi:cytochrome c553